MPHTTSFRPALLLACLSALAACEKPGLPLPEVNAASATRVEPVVLAPVTSPQQGFEQTIDCAALLAVHESAAKGQLESGSPTFDLISYALGKAQEYARAAGMETALVKIRYGEMTLGYFTRHEKDPAGFIRDTQGQADACAAALRQFEPGAQIQDALRTAVDRAQPGR